MAAPGTHKRTRIAAPDWLDPYAAAQFMTAVAREPDAIFNVCDTPDTFCEWLWDQRRALHLLLGETDTDGDGRGWCTLTRMLVLSARIRVAFAVRPAYCVRTPTQYEALAKAGLLVTRRPVASYDTTDVLNAVQLVCAKWTAHSMWTTGVHEITQHLEVFLYDLSMRTESLWSALHKTRMDHARNFVHNVARTIATIHSITCFARRQLFARTPRTSARTNLVPIDRVPPGESCDDVYVAGLERLRADMRRRYTENAKLGNMTETICATLQCLFAPLDVRVRAHIATGIAVDDIVYATRQVLPVCEFIWQSARMPEITPAQLLDSEEWDAEQAWLIRTICMLRVIEITISQFNTNFQWSVEALLFDRDAFRVLSVAPFSTSVPLVFVYGTTFFVIYRDEYYRVDDIQEAFFVWVMIIHRDYADKVASRRYAHFDLKKEIGIIFDICFPRRVEQELDDFGAASDEELDNATFELLETLGLLDLEPSPSLPGSPGSPGSSEPPEFQNSPTIQDSPQPSFSDLFDSGYDTGDG